jgi:hypothetical protein
MAEGKGFTESLFDFSFTSFVTSKIVQVLYALSIILSGIFSIFLIAESFAISGSLGMFMLLVGAPLVFFLCIVYARVMLELIVVIFRIAEDVNRIASQEGGIDSATSSEEI